MPAPLRMWGQHRFSTIGRPTCGFATATLISDLDQMLSAVEPANDLQIEVDPEFWISGLIGVPPSPLQQTEREQNEEHEAQDGRDAGGENRVRGALGTSTGAGLSGSSESDLRLEESNFWIRRLDQHGVRRLGGVRTVPAIAHRSRTAMRHRRRTDTGNQLWG